MGQLNCKLEKEIKKKVKLNYLLFLPKDYGNKNERYPMIVFLHGLDKRGDDLEIVKEHGIPKIVEDNEDFGFISVSPQCPNHSYWSMEIDALNALVDEIISTYDVDIDRIYLTGLSMGGYGTWDFAIDQPQRFAAIAPICEGYIPERTYHIKDVPVWAFHGAKDDIVPIERTHAMVNALKECGGSVEFTIHPSLGHDCWTETYNNPALYEWFLEHSRK